jgi:type VI secretion system protein ImpM
MTAGTDPAPGLFGKLPICGDFVSRRLPGRFVEAWDDWLRRAIACSRDVLAEDWLPLYLAGPLWRFALPPNLLSEDSIAGVLMLSVDAVNRHFPLTVAATAPPALGPFVLAAEADPWFAAAEALALSCLDPDATMSSVERSLDALGTLRACGEPGAPAEEPVTPPTGARLRWPLAGDLCQSVRASGLRILDAVAAATYGPFSLWWTTGSDDVEPVLLVFSGLPCPEAFSALLHNGRRARESVAVDRATASQPCSRERP